MQVPCHVKTCVEVHRFSARKERVRPYYLGLQGSFIFMSPCTSKHLIRTQIHSRSTVDLYEHVICAKEITFRMNQTKIRGAEAALDYNFHDLHILWEALQAAGSGVMRSGPRLFDNGNSKLAVLEIPWRIWCCAKCGMNKGIQRVTALTQCTFPRNLLKDPFRCLESKPCLCPRKYQSCRRRPPS